MMEIFKTDVLIVGGGPSGASAALSLLRHTSLNVSLNDQGAFDKSRVGEHVNGSLFDLMSYLGIDHNRFEPGSFVEGYSSMAAWGNGRIASRHSIHSAEGKSYQLDREKFDLLLIAEVANRGGKVYPRTKCVRIEQEENGCWRIHLRHEARGEFMIHTKFLIDASGRQSHVCRLLKINTQKHDQLAGIVTFLHFKEEKKLPMEVFIESNEIGWWYCAALPYQRMALTFFTDADIVKEKQLHRLEKWDQLLQKTKYVKHKVYDSVSYEPPVTRNAFSHIANTTARTNFLAIGDAVAAFDPISSMGIGFAVSSACHAARAINCFFEGEPTQIQAYHDSINEIFRNYLDIRKRYYQTEQRWAELPFWQRRLRNAPIQDRILPV